MRVSLVIVMSGTALILPAGSLLSYRSDITQQHTVQASDTSMTRKVPVASEIDFCASFFGRTPANFAYSRHLGWCHRFDWDSAACTKHFVSSAEHPGHVALCEYNDLGVCSLGSWAYCSRNSSKALNDLSLQLHGNSQNKSVASTTLKSGNLSIGALESTIRLLTRFEDETQEERKADYANEREQERECDVTKSRFQSIVVLSGMQISEFISTKQALLLVDAFGKSVAQARKLFLNASFMAEGSAHMFLSRSKELHAASLSLQDMRVRYKSIRNILLQLTATVRDHKQKITEARTSRGWWINQTSASEGETQLTSTLLNLATKVKQGLITDPLINVAPVSKASVPHAALMLASHFISLGDAAVSGRGLTARSHERPLRHSTGWHAEVVDLCDSTLIALANSEALRTKPLEMKISRLQQQAMEDKQRMHQAVYSKTATARALVAAKRGKFAVRNRFLMSGRNRAMLVNITSDADAGLSDTKFRCLLGHFDWQTIDTANRESLTTINNFVDLLRGQKHVQDEKLLAAVSKMS